MKKNISINISGIIFHIEEDGYDTLRKYLDSINSYFGTFEDSSEILADIESRIAEIFLSKLNDGKQIITAEDVQSLTATMGSVNDFKAAEAMDSATGDETKEKTTSEEAPRAESARRTPPPPKKLMRDHRRKILGGVCAGLANYFSIDPVWPRLLVGLLIISTYGIFLAVYIVFWIVLPFSTDLEDEPSVKKMFRDSEHKVIGGVAGGVAAYFGIDVVIVRVLFGLFTLFFGTGLVAYIILWLTLPEAKSITEKMQMQGEPVTLSNIESSVKKSLNEKEEEEESMLARIILFPFRMIAALIQGIARIVGPVLRLFLDIIRVMIGLCFAFSGTIMILSILFVTGILLGLFYLPAIDFGYVHISQGTFPLEAMRKAFPTFTVIVAFFAALIPATFIMLIGNAIISKKRIINPIAGWAMFVVFALCVVMLSFSIPRLVYTFKEEAEVKVEKYFASTSHTPVLKIKETGMDDYDFTHLSIEGYDGKTIKLVQRFEAQGSSRLHARENAQLVDYHVEQADSVITFDSNISFKPDARFSFQRLNMDLYIPFDKPFTIDPEMWHLIQDRWRFDYTSSDEAQTYKLTADGKLECVSCPPRPKDTSGIASDDQFGLKDFTDIEMTGLFNVIIRQGDEYAITIEGSDQRKKLYKIERLGETLEVSFAQRNKSFWKDAFQNEDLVAISITLPRLEKLKITGAGKIKISGFNEEEIKMSLIGAMVADARISARQMYIDMDGPIVLDLDGNGDFLEANISRAAQLKASSYNVTHAIIDARELSQARVNASQTLEIDKDFSSNIKYQGNPEMVKHD